MMKCSGKNGRTVNSFAGIPVRDHIGRRGLAGAAAERGDDRMVQGRLRSVDGVIPLNETSDLAWPEV
jgi:hypothetical protein